MTGGSSEAKPESVDRSVDREPEVQAESEVTIASDPAVSDAEAVLRFGPYVIIERIASGGMAEIFKVHHVMRHQPFLALKRIRPDCDDQLEFRAMLRDEARIGTRLDHPNIVRILDL